MSPDILGYVRKNGDAVDPEVIETLSGTYADYTLYSDRVVLVRLRAGLNIDEHAGKAGIDELQGFVGPGRHVVVVDGRQLGYIPPAGRAMVHKSINEDRIATALIAASAATEYLAKRFVTEGEAAGTDAAGENKVFFDEHEALAWAHALAAGITRAG